MRSKLFVPGSRPALFDKALRSEADAISIDLEDAVAATQKDQARGAVATFLQSRSAHQSAKVIIVRCNRVDSDDFKADLEAVAQPALQLLNLPKLESVDTLRLAIETLAAAERRNHITKPIGILATIESARGMRLAAEIAAADARVVGLQLGLVDLFESQGIDRANASNVHAAMFSLRLAAAEAGVFAVDGAFPDLKDSMDFRREAKMARSLGFCGKSCVHPCQVSITNDVFSLTADELAAASRIVEAARGAATDGGGVVMVDGKMIDLPLIERAERILATDAASRDRS